MLKMRKKDAIQETLFGSKLQIFQNRTIIINKSKFLEILDELLKIQDLQEIRIKSKN